ncbi:hypothetical protein CEXT_593731 [Caerostris extrusa]|uniref:Uncharacterized protein n=1 Tax=Caerostris extrusa TaxID=172846 RepID=A0AAV4VFE0_CAEEX|nr:hypothetical protein CEXT_593731 [Caerostris extrusa]
MKLEILVKGRNLIDSPIGNVRFEKSDNDSEFSRRDGEGKQSADLTAASAILAGLVLLRGETVKSKRFIEDVTEGGAAPAFRKQSQRIEKHLQSKATSQLCGTLPQEIVGEELRVGSIDKRTYVVGMELNGVFPSQVLPLDLTFVRVGVIHMTAEWGRSLGAQVTPRTQQRTARARAPRRAMGVGAMEVLESSSSERRWKIGGRAASGWSTPFERMR